MCINILNKIEFIYRYNFINIYKMECIFKNPFFNNDNKFLINEN